MKEMDVYHELFQVLFDAARQAETELCKSGEVHAEAAKKILSNAIDCCYDRIQDWSGSRE